ncbi:MAG: hypothetical protein GXY79_11475 [Chloroflexi bacterium]|nr:hypothetical protein [Chloroflexota bacterium]
MSHSESASRGESRPVVVQAFDNGVTLVLQPRDTSAAVSLGGVSTLAPTSIPMASPA